ncbi:hypothetical protein [Zhongshania sp.]|uniref:hypothetical protein n=1 Tax=Zhongshania sp. TaxID=1971902 RepID=UPI002A80A160|nr:hypothetical protein [Zhongshania sp.]
MRPEYLKNIEHEGPVSPCVFYLHMLATGERIRLVWGIEQTTHLMHGPDPDEQTTGDIEHARELFGIDIKHIDIPVSAFLLDGRPCRIREYYMPATPANLTKSYNGLKEFGFRDLGCDNNLRGKPA